MADPQFTDAPLPQYTDAPLPSASTRGWGNALAANPDGWKPNSSSSSLSIFAASKILPVAEQAVSAGLAAPNAPRIIQRAIGAGVRGLSTATGAAVGGVPGAVAGAAMSEGLTPTQQTIRGWLGRTAATKAASAAPTAVGDAVANYIESMGADAKNLGPAALEYAKKAGRAVLYDESGHPYLVPAAAVEQGAPAATAAATGGATSTLGTLARKLSMLSGVQGGLDLAQMVDPKRTDIGFLGVGASHDPIDPKDVPIVNEGIAKVFDKMGRSDLAKLWRGER